MVGETEASSNTPAAEAVLEEAAFLVQMWDFGQTEEVENKQVALYNAGQGPQKPCFLFPSIYFSSQRTFTYCLLYSFMVR